MWYTCIFVASFCNNDANLKDQFWYKQKKNIKKMNE